MGKRRRNNFYAVSSVPGNAADIAIYASWGEVPNTKYQRGTETLAEAIQLMNLAGISDPSVIKN